MKIDFKDKKYLVTSGCSFTDGFRMAKKGSWAYYLADLMDLQYHNKARGGSGNEYISNSIISYLINNSNIRENCVVGVAWSDVSRLMSSMYDGQYNILDTVQPFDFFDNGKYHNKKDASMFFSDIPFCVYKTYMSIIKLNHFLEYYKIPYFYIDAISKNRVVITGRDEFTMYGADGKLNKNFQFNFADYPNQYRYIINNKMNSTIFDNFLKIGNYNTILEYMNQDYHKYEKGNPGHPNDIASKEIAEIIYNQIS